MFSYSLGRYGVVCVESSRKKSAREERARERERDDKAMHIVEHEYYIKCKGE